MATAVRTPAEHREEATGSRRKHGSFRLRASSLDGRSTVNGGGIRGFSRGTVI